MHSIRRMSLHPLQTVSALPRRLSDFLGPNDTLPSNGGQTVSSLPRRLSLALLAPLLGPKEDHHLRSPEARSPLLGPGSRGLSPGGSEKNTATDRPIFSPDVFKSPSASPAGLREKTDPLDKEGKRVARRQSTGLLRRRNYILALVVLSVGLVTLVALYLTRPTVEETKSAESVYSSLEIVDSPPSTSDSWLTGAWPSVGASDSPWLSWTSSSDLETTETTTTTTVEPEVGGEWEKANLWRKFEQPAFVNVSGEGRGDRFIPVEIFNDACLESWIGKGVPCARDLIESDGPPPTTQLDVVFTWVNGSDSHWEQEHDSILNRTIVYPIAPPARHYRSTKDELRHSVRSVMTHMQPPPQRLHLVFGDWEDTALEAPLSRRGQVPGWLNWNGNLPSTSLVGSPLPSLEGGNKTTSIHVHHHSEIFLSPTSLTPEAQTQYLRDSLPNFNSFAIESQLHNIGDDMGNTIAYHNDDFFLLKKHTTGDFGSPMYGTVLRLGDPAAYVIPSAEEPLVGCEHEWSSLLRSNWLLSRRFGFKDRGYLQHVAKTLSKPMMYEMHAIWANAFAEAAKRRFRETATGRFGDLNTSWMSSFLLIERARESMLWVWAVANLGGTDGVWGAAERDKVRAILAFAPLSNGTTVARRTFDEPRTALVRRVVRGTIALETIKTAFEGFGEQGPEATHYRWSSLDGTLPGKEGKKAPCEMDLNECFGPWWTGELATVSAVDMFKRLTFLNGGKCGDCMLNAVIAHSGGYGLSSLLPEAGITYQIPADSLVEHSPNVPFDLAPHMPITPEWMETKFALGDVLAGTNPSKPDEKIDLRKWSLRLIARYQFVDSSTNALFSMVTSPTSFAGLVERLTMDWSIVSLGMNDDIEEVWTAVLEPLVKSFLDVKFSVRGWWERLVL